MSTRREEQDRLLNEILARAQGDDQFRSRLLVEPKEAIWEAFGVRVPAGYRLRFIEKGKDVDALVVLPDRKEESDELTEEELEDVAGGVPTDGDWSSDDHD